MESPLKVSDGYQDIEPAGVWLLIRLDDIVYSLVLKEVEWAEKTNNKVYKWSWVENANRTIKSKQSKDVLV